MMNTYRAYFGLTQTPFSQDVKELLPTVNVTSVLERIRYVMELGAVGIITGDIGSGKSSAVRFAINKLHPAEHSILYVTATTGSVIELYRQIAHSLKLETLSPSRSYLQRAIKQAVAELTNKKRKLLLIVDEASLLRLDVFGELHTLLQYHIDSKGLLPLLLVGQSNLVDMLSFSKAKALASRVVARGHMQPLSEDEVRQYLEHHLKLAGCKRNLFTEEAMTAIRQGASGALRKINNLARGGLIAAAKQEQQEVSAEHIRVAATELI